MGMVWAVGGGGCAGLGGQTSLTRDAGRKDTRTALSRSVFCVCAVVLPRVLYSRAATVWSCAHVASIPLVYIKQKVSDLFEVLSSRTSAGFRELVLEIAPRSPTPREAGLGRSEEY